MDIDKCKNSAALAATKDDIDFLCIDNSHLNFILIDLGFSRLFMLRSSSASGRSAFRRTSFLN